MKTSKRYPGDVGSATVPKDITKYARIGVIQSVDSEAGLCTIRWYDKPSYQKDVIITQSFSGGTSIPEKGSTIIAVLDQFSRAFIVGYINLGHENRVKSLKTLPKLKEGEKFFEAGGSYIYIKRNGSVAISTLTGGVVEFSNTTQTWKYEVVNWKLITEGGTSNFGLVKRMVLNSDGTSSIQAVKNENESFYTEHNLTLYEYADGTVGINPSQTPLVSITFGTVIDKDGNVINKLKNTTLDKTKQLAARLDFKSGIVISIDKAGVIDIRGGKLKLNEPSVDVTDIDAITGLDINDTTKGTKGQHLAREHDKVTIPVSSTYVDDAHKGLINIATSNLAFFQTLATAFISAGPGSPCTLNPTVLIGQLKIEGEITEGASNILVGDE
jgi:hypothetical protein